MEDIGDKLNDENSGKTPTLKMHNVGTVSTYKTHNIGTKLSYATLGTTIKLNSIKLDLIELTQIR